MFGPNYIFRDDVDIKFTHRDNKFKELLKLSVDNFKSKFSLYDYDILFIPGTASVGMESVISSLKYPVNVIGYEGTFKSKWKHLCEYYNKINDTSNIDLYCLLETSCSTYNKPTSSKYSIIDATSGFPYYPIPDNCAAFVTCLNKQLGSYIGVAVVCIRKDCWNLFSNNSIFSYLNLAKYREYIKEFQTPTTFPMFILEHFNNILDSFNLDSFRQRIDNNSIIVKNSLNSEIIGSGIGPVLTIPRHNLDSKLCQKYNLYGYDCGRPNIQIFTYSEQDYRYIDFANNIKKG